MTFRNIAIWAVIGVLLVALYGVLNRGSHAGGPAQITYSQLLNRVDSGRIKAATIRGEIVEARDSDGKSYTTVTPMNQDDLIKRLGATGADIDVKPCTSRGRLSRAHRTDHVRQTGRRSLSCSPLFRICVWCRIPSCITTPG